MDGIVEQVYEEPSVPPVIGESYSEIQIYRFPLYASKSFYYKTMVQIVYNVLIYNILSKYTDLHMLESNEMLSYMLTDLYFIF